MIHLSYLILMFVQVNFNLAASYDPCTRNWLFSCAAPTIRINDFYVYDARVAFDRIYDNSSEPATYVFGNLALEGKMNLDGLSANVSYMQPDFNASVFYRANLFDLELALQYNPDFSCEEEDNGKFYYPLFVKPSY